MPEPIWRPSTRARQLVNVRFPCFRLCVLLPGMVGSVTNGVASAWSSCSTGSDLWESNEEDALGSVGRELLDLPDISVIVHVEAIDFLTATAASSLFLKQYTRALWLASFGATFKLDKVAEATIQSFDGARRKATQSGAASWIHCLVRILASQPIKSPENKSVRIGLFRVGR